MVCKEELCTWFRNLSPHKRIDYMCGMLQMCLPMELRFMGSYVEDLAKKDFHQLRESEGKANSRHELSKFSETDAKVFRTKMAVYLALLHSSNRTSSNIIFQLLESQIQEALTVIDNMDVMTVHSILLVLSMAMNHPAFSYHQKSRTYEYYIAANQAAERIFKKPEPELLILSESCKMRSCDQRISPICSPRVSSMHLIPSPTAHEKVHVCDIEVKSSRHRDTEKNAIEYVIQVTWSNGEKKDVFKTYQELVEFHNKLQKTFPEELISHQKAIKLPAIKGSQNHKKDLSRYATLLSDLPEHIRESNCFSSFFEMTIHRETRVEMMDASTSPRPPLLAGVPIVQRLPNSGDEETVIDQQYGRQTPSQTLYTSYLSQSPINGDMCSLSPHSPSHHELAYPAAVHSPSCSTKTTSPLISSPCHSPVSSMESVTNSVSGSPSVQDREETSLPPHSKLGTEATAANHNTEEVNVSALLKFHNLSLYADIFSNYSLEQVASMTFENLETIGVRKEIASTIKAIIFNKIREKQPPFTNGLIEPAAHTGLMWPPIQAYMPSLPAPGTMPPLPYHQAPPGAYQPVFNYPPFQDVVSMVPGARDLSPTNSEYSSPSPSPHLPAQAAVRKPHLQLALTDSSSDDGERDKRHGQYRGSTKWKGHSAPNSARSNWQDKNTDVNQESNSNSVTPPLLTETSDTNVNNVGNYGNSGYTSDPTFTRPQVLRTSYKAQPVHTNIPTPSKFLINMPDNNFKGGAQSMVPMVMPQHMRDISMIAASGHQGYSMSAADLGQRSMFYLPNGQAMMARSHFNPVNVTGPRPVFPPGAPVNHTMVPGPHPVMNGNAPTGSNGNGFHGTQSVVPPSPMPACLVGKSPNVIMNGVENHSINASQSSESCTHRPPAIANSVTSSSGNTGATNRAASCTSCGCPGHNQTPQPIPFMPQIHHTNMWHSPYSNGMLPMPMQHLYVHHNPYPNGLNQEMLCNPMYGMSHSNTSASVPNVICGYNNYGNHVTVGGGYSQKRTKKLNCHNCGSSKHLAADCSEVSMEAMSSHNMYSYKPKNESD